MASDHTPRAPVDRTRMGTAATLRLPQQAPPTADSGDPSTRSRGGQEPYRPARGHADAEHRGDANAAPARAPDDGADGATVAYAAGTGPAAGVAVRIARRRRPAPTGHRAGAASAEDIEAYVRRVVDAAPDLTPGQVQRLRDLLPPMGE